MEDSVRWFLFLAIASLLGMWLGAQIARRTRHHGRVGIIVALILLGFWAWMLRHPAVAVRVIPVSILSRIEGAASVPVFMFIIGIAWVRACGASQKRLVAWGMVLGVVYFLQGSLWMLESTPQVGFADTYDQTYVRQSQEYSCVPAACATALHMLDIPATELEMAQLTETRPGTGSTLLRAMDGLNAKLSGSRYQVTLLELPLDQLRTMPTPALTALQFETTRCHMVAITRITPFGAWVADPVDGMVFYGWQDLEPLYRGQVLVAEARR